MAPDIFYINYDGSSCSVYQSQVLGYCVALQKYGVSIRLINCQREVKASENSSLNSFPIFNVRKGKYDLIISSRLVAEITELIKGETKGDAVIHCRGIFAGIIGLKVRKKIKSRNIRVITDIRGACPEEYLLRYKDRGKFMRVLAALAAIVIKQFQKKICLQSDHIFCVSERLKEYLLESCRVKGGIMVVPTCIKRENYLQNLEERSRVRLKMNLKDKFVLVYSGGGQEYQNISGMAAAFKYLSEIIDNAYFLVLTCDNSRFQVTFEKFSISSSCYTIMEVPQNAVNSFLNAADCGVMLREADIVNKVASPTKFAEYVCCGLPVLVSRGIGDIDAINSIFPVCIYEEQLVNFMKIYEEIKSNRTNFHSLIEQYYSIDRKMGDIIEIYGGNK